MSITFDNDGAVYKTHNYFRLLNKIVDRFVDIVVSVSDYSFNNYLSLSSVKLIPPVASLIHFVFQYSGVTKKCCESFSEDFIKYSIQKFCQIFYNDYVISQDLDSESCLHDYKSIVKYFNSKYNVGSYEAVHNKYDFTGETYRGEWLDELTTITFALCFPSLHCTYSGTNTALKIKFVKFYKKTYTFLFFHLKKYYIFLFHVLSNTSLSEICGRDHFHFYYEIVHVNNPPKIIHYHTSRTLKQKTPVHFTKIHKKVLLLLIFLVIAIIPLVSLHTIYIYNKPIYTKKFLYFNNSNHSYNVTTKTKYVKGSIGDSFSVDILINGHCFDGYIYNGTKSHSFNFKIIKSYNYSFDKTDIDGNIELCSVVTENDPSYDDVGKSTKELSIDLLDSLYAHRSVVNVVETRGRSAGKSAQFIVDWYIKRSSNAAYRTINVMCNVNIFDVIFMKSPYS